MLSSTIHSNPIKPSPKYHIISLSQLSPLFHGGCMYHYKSAIPLPSTSISHQTKTPLLPSLYPSLTNFSQNPPNYSSIKMMMMMIMIAAYVNSITTPIKSWLQKDSHDHHHNTQHNITVKELTVNSPRVDCIVCLSEVVLGERLAMLERCGHGYHVECLEGWLKDHPNCPLCRTPVSGSDQDCTTHNHSLYLKRFCDIVSRFGTGALETMAGWVTSSFTQGLQSTLSESCNYL